jgi:hypothetical protein
VVGVVAIVLGVVAARASRRWTSDWWMGAVGAVLGAFPPAVVAWAVFATLMGWAEWR